MDPFLCIGITLAVFRFVGKIPVVKERLIILERGTEISAFIEDKILEGMLYGPVDLLVLREDIQSITSVESVGERKIEFSTGFFKKDEKCLEA